MKKNEKKFNLFLDEKNKKGSQKASSYIRALELLDLILINKAENKLKGFSSIYNIEAKEIIEELYQFILEEQNKDNSIFENEEPKSYWQGKFYSAAIKAYLDFLNKFTPLQEFPDKQEKLEINSESIREFALLVFNHFYRGKWDKLIKNSSTKYSTINDLEYEIIDYKLFKNLIGIFKSPQDKSSLSSAGTIRYFEDAIHNENGKFFYFTTQWSATGEYNLSFLNLQKFIEEEYPKYKVIREGKTFSLLLNSSPLVINDFSLDCSNANLKYSDQLITRYISSLATKPFVLLSGLSGSGKTKLAQSFAQWICESKEQYCIVPVGADWTNREPLLGYVNALETSKYILPENGALELIIRANTETEKPFFLILDEMNLSHVERYFADFLSVMESKDKFKLHSSDDPLDGENGIKVDKGYRWPKNLFVVGTVNIDETTYMFSPKVLDRANVIEFRITEEDMSDYLSESRIVTDLDGEGKGMGRSFVEIAKEETKANPTALKDALNEFFVELKKVGAEFGYRTASEIQILFSKIDLINPTYASKTDEKIDIAIMQKLLPKLHGSRTKLVDVLKLLANLCVKDKEYKSLSKDKKGKIFETIKEDKLTIIYPISLEKIERMYDNVISNGFTSYAEA
ncbi:MAG: 5-methylcytosine-specific restriction protein B [Maribacter sp.]|jgi:5-methylcytosine-specific restriction protein B